MMKILASFFLVIGIVWGGAGCMRQDMTNISKKGSLTVEPLAVAPKEPESNFYIQQTASGALQLTDADKQLYTLYLYNVKKFVIHLDPASQAKEIVEIGSFIADWGQRAESLKASPPQGALEIVNGPEESDVFLLALSNPRYDAIGGQLTYDATPLEEVPQSLSSQSERHDSIPELLTFRNALIWLDVLRPEEAPKPQD
jgi:hypothetical protein